ncbi:MAG: hypothetical protein PHT08_04975 [Bacteroidales bacterium]|nr:hypothetical protein [Bacteroidales bacterium]
MKKFLKWSAAFLLLGVLAVGCVKNEPSAGIEAMRNAKAALLNANAELVKAKVQVEAANAALIQAQATLKLAEAERVKAQAQIDLAYADLVKAKAERERAETDIMKEEWALKVQELELQLQELEAQVQASIQGYQLAIQMMQTEMVKAQQAYEEALADFEAWKREHAAELAEELIDSLNDIVFQIQRVMRDIAAAQVDLNVAYAAYDYYVNVTYPEATEGVVLMLQQEKRRLTCQIEYLEGLVAAYTAMYEEYHGDFDAFIAGLQEQINEWQATAAEQELAQLQLKKDMIDLDAKVQAAAYAAFHDDSYEFSATAWSDPVDDQYIHVDSGVYVVEDQTLPGMLKTLAADIAVIEDTRAQFEGQGVEDVEVTRAAYVKNANDAAKAYTDKWTKWQTNYAGIQLGTGSLYKAWDTAYKSYLATLATYTNNFEAYKWDYERAEVLIDEYMEGLKGTLVDGVMNNYFGNGQLSEVLGGIYFNADNLLKFIVGGNTALLNALESFLVYMATVDQMNDIVTELKSIMDGTHSEGYPAFWDIATACAFTKTAEDSKLRPQDNEVMRSIYTEEAGKDITALTERDWHTWLFLYWLFENKTLEAGLEDFGTIFTINPAPYTDAGLQVLNDFFSSVTPGALTAPGTPEANGGVTYAEILAWPSYDNKAELAWKAAVIELGTLENDMFDPYDRVWSWTYTAPAKNPDSRNPAYHTFSVSPTSYTPPTYLDVEPFDATEFYFRIEDHSTYYPSLEMDVTYFGEDCDLYVSYAALLAADEYCGAETSDWAGDLLLWYYDTDTHGKGHYFYALKQQRILDAFNAAYNHVINGDYAALQATLEEAYASFYAIYMDKYQVFNDLHAQYVALWGEYNYIVNYYLPQLQIWIDEYVGLITEAKDAHTSSDEAIVGLTEILEAAEQDLLAAKQEMTEIDTIIANWEAGYGLYVGSSDFWPAMADAELGRHRPDYNNFYQQYRSFVRNFIADQSARYAAEIDVVLLEIENLYDVLAVLEAQRAALVASIE